MIPTNLRQGAAATYSTTALTILWDAPTDTGCLPIVDYKIQKYDTLTLSWVDAASGILTTTGAITGLTPGV
jgi:hypothetical protein